MRHESSSLQPGSPHSGLRLTLKIVQFVVHGTRNLSMNNGGGGGGGGGEGEGGGRGMTLEARQHVECHIIILYLAYYYTLACIALMYCRHYRKS